MTHIRHLLTLTAMLAFAVTAMAQTTNNTVKGFVCDEEGEAMLGATVTVTSQGGDAKKHLAIVKEDGSFRVDSVPGGAATLTVTSIGYEDYKQAFKSDGETNLGVIKMRMSAEMLDEVTVMAKFTSIKSNGETVIQVKGNPLAKGKTLTDFLKYNRDIDVSSNNLSVRGKQNTLIYLDNKKISFSELSSIPPSMIERIEVIPEANALYGVNATGGVVKIILRDDAGLLGNVSLNGSVYDKFSYNPSVNLLYSYKKLTINNYARGGTRKSLSETAEDRHDKYGESQTNAENDLTQDYFSDNLSLRYKFNDVDQLDIYGGVSLSNSDNLHNSVVKSGAASTMMRLGNYAKTRIYSAGLQFKKQLGSKPDNYLHFRADYYKNKSDESQNYRYDGISEPARLHSDMNNITINPYVSLKPSSKVGLRVGVDYSYLRDKHENTGTPTLSYIQDGRYSTFGHDIGAWGEADFYISNSLYLRAVLNYHSTNSKYKDYLNKGNNVDYWENGIYPTVFGQWLINKDKQRALQVSYRHFYSLPNYNYRLPTVTWQNENTYSIGNTDLNKENYDLAEVTFMFNSSLSMTYRFWYGDDLVNVIMHQDPVRPGVYYTRPENTGNRRAHILRLNYSGRIFKFWYTNNTLTGDYTDENAGENSFNHAFVVFNSYNDFTICKNIGAQLSFAASTKQKNASYECKSSYGLSLGVYAFFLSNKLQVQLYYSNVFYDEPEYKMHGLNWQATRKDLSTYSGVNLSLSWNFSAGRKIKNVQLPKSQTDGGRLIPTF